MSETFWNLSRNEDGSGELQIDGVLMTDESWWGDDGIIVARDFRKALEKVSDVTVWINSPGGDVMAGAEIYTALREHSASGKGKVTVKVSGIAASAASVVAMAGDEIYMSPVAYMMIHNPWTYVQGNAKDLEHEVEVLRTITEGLISAYQIRTGKDRDEIVAMLDAETYMSAAECVAEGFADGLLWDQAGSSPAGNTAKAARMTAKAFGSEKICAMIRAHEEPHPPAEEQPAEEPAEEPAPEEEPAPAPEDPEGDPGATGKPPEETTTADEAEALEAEWRRDVAMRAAALSSALEYILSTEG